LFLLSADDIALLSHRREIFRWLHPAERLGLQGFSPRLSLKLKTAHLITKAAGNAYPTPLMAAVLGPLLERIGETTPSLTVGKCIAPRPETLQFKVHLLHKSRIVKPKGHATKTRK